MRTNASKAFTFLKRFFFALHTRDTSRPTRVTLYNTRMEYSNYTQTNGEQCEPDKEDNNQSDKIELNISAASHRTTAAATASLKVTGQLGRQARPNAAVRNDLDANSGLPDKGLRPTSRS